MSDVRVGTSVDTGRARALSFVVGLTATSNNFLQASANRALAASRGAAEFTSFLLTPAAVSALALGLWSLTAEMGWTSSFPVENGMFSHWLVWIALAIGLKMTGSILDRPE